MFANYMSTSYDRDISIAAVKYARKIAQTEPLRPEQLHVAIIGADATGVELFAKLVRQLQARHIKLHISGIKLPVEQAPRRAGCLQTGPDLVLYRTDAEALTAMQQQGKPPEMPSEPWPVI